MQLYRYNGQLVRLTMDDGEELVVQPLEYENQEEGTYRVRSFTSGQRSKFDTVIILNEDQVAAVDILPEEIKSGIALTLSYVPDIRQAYEIMKGAKLPSKVSFGRIDRDDNSEKGDNAMYAVELFFNDAVERSVRLIWRELHELGISSTMYGIEEQRPHITVAVYNEIGQVEQLLEKVEAFMAKRDKLRLNFDVVGTFPTTRTLFASPTVTQELLRFHADYYAQCGGDWAASVSPLYIPGGWNPHCTLAIKLTDDQLRQAMAHVVPNFMPIAGETVELGVVKLHWQEGSCVRSPLVRAYRFR
ncbi:2'-5' RNA ligase family protein [Paenibacillus mendelii]|uniref:2'-5' RNA ligase family protein n=1 Tax=Paenibacillus mendelii TaxID=206163 RepID=A0ABV6JE65_9BACL|nr:2'-5' RNA ligase family protein [Paenibacillus mendelii]MCQ6562497.1 2'-5' RNA ligase family protein [Paenibacillus mendelii]